MKKVKHKTQKIEGELKILNWNIGGAKYLELRSEQSTNRKQGDESRENFRIALNKALASEIELHHPQVLTLQEVVEY